MACPEIVSIVQWLLEALQLTLHGDAAKPALCLSPTFIPSTHTPSKAPR